MLYDKLGEKLYNKIFDILLWITNVLAIALIVLILTACGKPAPEPVQTLPPAEKVHPVQIPSPAPTPAPTPEPTSEPEPAAAPEPEPEPKPSEEPVEETPADISPDLIAFLDSYEAFVDKYIEFMRAYMKNPTDFNLLMQYSSILAEYSKFTQAVDNYDTSTMNEAESLYFAEVTLRCSQKMLKALG